MVDSILCVSEPLFAVTWKDDVHLLALHEIVNLDDYHLNLVRSSQETTESFRYKKDRNYIGKLSLY